MTKPKAKTVGKKPPPNIVDKFVARRIRAVRRMRRMSAAQVAKGCKITTQSVYNYETGVSKITMGQLWELSRVLDVKMVVFLPPEEQ